MAIALSNYNVTFIEDLAMGKEVEWEHIEVAEATRRIEHASQFSSKNCWIAVGVYLGTLILSIHQYWLNGRASGADYQRQL